MHGLNGSDGDGVLVVVCGFGCLWLFSRFGSNVVNLMEWKRKKNTHTQTQRTNQITHLTQAVGTHTKHNKNFSLKKRQ